MSSVLEELFGRVLVINLDRRPERLERVTEELAALHVDEWERVAGIDTPENGYIGSGNTHRLIWRRIAAGEFGESALIFEDDFTTLLRRDLLSAGFTEDSEVVRVYDSAPWRPVFDALPHLLVSERLDYLRPFIPADWDVLYLGGHAIGEAIWRANAHAVRVPGLLGTFAYAMTRAGAAKITEALDIDSPGVWAGAADIVIGGLARTLLHCYVMLPRLFIEAPGENDNHRQVRTGFPQSHVDVSHGLGLG